MRKAKTSDAMEWIRAKLSQLAAREAEPPPVAASRPKATPPRGADITECPADVDPVEWQQALANVRAGSAPCKLKFPPEPTPPYPGAFTAAYMERK